MKDEVTNSFAGNNNPPADRDLLAYLHGEGDAAAREAIEQQMAVDPMIHDAVQGLETVPDKTALPSVVDLLHQQLHRQLKQKKSPRPRDFLKEHIWIYLTIVLILLLCVTGFLIIRYFQLRK